MLEKINQFRQKKERKNEGRPIQSEIVTIKEKERGSRGKLPPNPRVPPTKKKKSTHDRGQKEKRLTKREKREERGSLATVAYQHNIAGFWRRTNNGKIYRSSEREKKKTEAKGGEKFSREKGETDPQLLT